MSISYTQMELTYIFYNIGVSEYFFNFSQKDVTVYWLLQKGSFGTNTVPSLYFI